WREGVVVQCGTSVGSVVIQHSSQQCPFVSLVVRAFGGTQKDVVSLFRLLDGTLQNLLLFYGAAAVATTVLCPFCLLPSHPSASFEFAFLVLNASQLSCPRCAAPIPLQAGIPDLLVSDHAHLQLSLEQVELGEEIAKGGFGTVFQGTYQKQQVAVKMLNLAPGDQPKPSSAKDPLFHMQSEQFAELSHEAFIMAQCDHPNIVKLFGFHFSAGNSCLVMELMSAGTLFDLLHTMPSTNPLLAVVMAVEVAKGMYHLHSREPPIVHGDLKSPNILISSRSHPLLQYPIAYWRLCFHFTSKPDDDPDRLQAVRQFAMEASLPVADGPAIRGQWAQLVALLQPADSHTPIAKIADFGASESVFVDELTRDAIVENPIWLAPEQIDSVWSDVWSFGIVMYEVASLAMPYSQMTFKFSFELSDAIKRGLRPDLSSLPPDLPQAYLGLMTGCWALNPSDRPTFDAILLALTSISIQSLLLI
ncbi:MAG: protein kinase, partial [archaeon]|nr:protein kinase [archaeon]